MVITCGYVWQFTALAVNAVCGCGTGTSSYDAMRGRVSDRSGCCQFQIWELQQPHRALSVSRQHTCDSVGCAKTVVCKFVQTLIERRVRKVHKSGAEELPWGTA